MQILRLCSENLLNVNPQKNFPVSVKKKIAALNSNLLTPLKQAINSILPGLFFTPVLPSNLPSPLSKRLLK